MTLDPVTSNNSMLESDLATANRQGNVTMIRIMEVLGEGYYLIATLKSSTFDWYVATRRVRTEPRTYKDLQKLRKYLAQQYPSISIVFEQDQAYPPKRARAKRKL